MAEKILKKDHNKITVSTMPGDWDSCTDPKSSRPMTKMRRTARGPKEASGGDLEFEDLTLTRFFEPTRDAAIVRQWNTKPAFYDGTVVTLIPLDDDGVPIGSGLSYIGKVMSAQHVGADANSEDDGKLEIVVSVERAA